MIETDLASPKEQCRYLRITHDHLISIQFEHESSSQYVSLCGGDFVTQ